MTGPIDFDRLFGASSSPDKDEESQAPASSGIDYTKLFGPQAKTPQQTGAELTQSFAEPAVARTKTAQETIQEIIDQASQPFARDITGSAESYGQYTEGARPGEERAARILRQQKEYLESPQAVDDFFQQSATTISAPPTGWERLAQIVGSARFFTNRSLLEFNHNNESGFQIGTPIAQAMVHPYEVGKGLVTGLPHFFIGLISKPATLYADALTGGKYLLPEERDEVIRTTIADYAGLFAGGAGGAMIKEMAAGRSILRAGVQSALEKGLPVATEDLITLNQTLPRALAIEGSLGSKIKMGVIEGAIGGATTGFLSGRTPEESRNLAASYAIMALPAGVAFEGVLGRLRKHEIGPLTAIAHDAGQLSIVRQLQAAGEQSILNGTNTFFALRNANDLAQAAQLAEVGRPVIVQGVSQFRPNEFSLIHLRPDGLMDISFGGVPDLIDIPNVVSYSRPIERYKSPEDVMGARLTEDYFDPGNLDPETGEQALIARAGTQVTPDVLAELNAAGYERIRTTNGWAALEKTTTSKPLFVSGVIDELRGPMLRVDEALERGDLNAARQALPDLINVMVDKRIDFPDINPYDTNLTLDQVHDWVDGIAAENRTFRRGTPEDAFQTGPRYRVGDPVGELPAANIDIPAHIRAMPDEALDAAIQSQYAKLRKFDDPRDIAEVTELIRTLEAERSRRFFNPPPRPGPNPFEAIGAQSERLGDFAEGEEVFMTNGKWAGRVIRVIRDELGDATGYTVVDSEGKQHVVTRDQVVPLQAPPNEGPVSFARTGEGTVGTSMDKSLLKKLGANLYKGTLGNTIIKEGIQNAIDAIRPTGGKGKVIVDSDPYEGKFSFHDTGIGMTPEVAANQFMDVGGSAKPGGASGGYGLAKVGLLSNAEHFEMTTVAETPTGKKRTTISGSSDDWVDGTLKYVVDDVPDDTPTGTKLDIQVPKEMVGSSYEVRGFIQRVQQYSRDDLRIEVPPGSVLDAMQPEPTLRIKTVDLKNAELDISHSEDLKEITSPYDGINVHVLNNGLYQFTIFERARGVVPDFITVDVKSKVSVDDLDYPFTTSREELKSGVDKAIKEYMRDISIEAAKKEALNLISTLRDSPEIPNTLGISTPIMRVMDTSLQLPKDLVESIAKSEVAQKLAKELYGIIYTIAEVMDRKSEQIDPVNAGSYAFNNFSFGGLAVAKGYLGLNISSKALNDVAAAAKVPDTGIKENVILFNPFVVYQEALKADHLKPNEVPLAERLADHTVGTLVHEIVHEVARGHDEYFAGVLTRAIGTVLADGADAKVALENLWYEVLGDKEFDAFYNELGQKWSDKDAFKSISSHATPEDYAGGPVREPEGRERLQPRPGDTPERPAAGTRPREVVRGSEATSGEQGSTGAGLQPSGRSWRDHAEAVFQVSGFFPNEVVNFLGNDYHYVDPIIGKNGVLEGHKIKGPDGDIVEVPWDQLRHGPDMAVNSFLFDKPQAQQALFDHFMGWTEKFRPGDLDTKPFSDVVASYVAQQGLNPRTIAALHRFLSDRYGELLRKESLAPQERATYTRIVKEISDYRQKSSANLVDAASSNGMYIERQNGALIVRDSQTGAFLELAHSPEEALKFVNQIAADKAPDFTPPGIPDGVNRGLIPVPPPPGGPHTSAFNPHSNGWFGELRDLFNISRLGTHFTGMRQIMISLDNQLGTKFIENVYQPLQNTHLRKYANMHDDMLRAAASARLSRGLTPEQGEQVTMGLETMAPDDMIKAGGLFNRPFTPRELKASQWFVNNQIDVKKAFQYYRALKNLERRSQFYQLPEGDKVEATHKLQASLNVDEAHIEAARIIGKVLQINKPGELSIYGIVRLAEAIMDGHLSPTEYINKHFPPADTEAGVKMRQLHAELQSHFRDLADTFDIPEEQRLGGYFAHLRNFKNDEIIANRDGAPIFTSELLRTGEMSEYDRDPINVLVRYINAGYASKFTREALDNAYAYVNKQTAKFNDPAQGEYVKRLITENYINEIRGIPHASTTFAEKLMNKVLDRLGVKSDVSVRRDLVNTFLSLSSSAAIGFRPMQGIRDFHNFSSIYFSRFGPERLGDLFTIMARVTPQELEQAGIIAKSHIGESTAAALAREGVTPTLAPVSVLTAQERLQNSLAARSAPYREAIQRTAELGIKWGLQHNVYQWAHAATYLEASTRALKELNNLSQGKYGAGAEAKAKAYENLFINSYDPPVAAYFDRLVTEGKFKDAADFLGRATSFETVSVFGLANHPAGWGTNFGRLFGQFGNWPVWARTTLTRGLSRGTRAERTRVAVRFGLTQASLALASSALGLNLNSWFLPTAAPLFSAGQHLAAAQDLYDDEKTAELKQAAAAVILGVPGSALFRGGPAFGLIQSSVETGQAYPTAEREGARALTQFPLMLVPGGFLIRDIYEGARMAENGDNPMSAWLRAFGIRSTPDESLLNPAGIVVE